MASDGKGVDTNVKHAMNPFDEIAVEEAVRLREKHKEAITKIVSETADFTLHSWDLSCAFPLRNDRLPFQLDLPRVPTSFEQL